MTLTARMLQLARSGAGWLSLSALARTLHILGSIALLVIPVTALTTGRPVRDVLVAMAVISLVKAGLYYGEHFLGHLVAFRMLDQLRVQLFDALVPQAPAVTEEHGSGRLLAQATKEINRIEVFYAHTIVPATTAVVVPLLVLPWVGLTYGWVPVVVLLLGTVATVVAGMAGSGAQARTSRGIADERASLAQIVTDNVAGRTDIVSFQAEGRRLDVVDAQSRVVGGLVERVGRIVGARRSAVQAVEIATLLCLVAWAVSAGGGVALAAIVVAPGLLRAGRGVEDFATSLPAARVAARNVFGLIDGAPVVAEDASPTDLPEGDGTVVVDSVTFQYPDRDRPALDSVSVTASGGSMLAVIGATGSGKSTLARLLLRFWDVGSGRILLDGVDIRRLRLADLRRAVSLVEQEPFLFAGTVAENLRMGNPEATDAELEQAAGIAQIHDDIASWPNGYATRLGENGQSVSGGQRQRIALARALVRGSRVIVLDESTAHQDERTQYAITSALPSCGATLVVIAHRLETIRAADQVVELRDGRLV